jgi:hypothetical protein
MIENAAACGVLAAQALGEFINVVRRRAPELLGKAIDQVEALSAIYVVAPTDAKVIREAGSLSRQLACGFGTRSSGLQYGRRALAFFSPRTCRMAYH